MALILWLAIELNVINDHLAVMSYQRSVGVSRAKSFLKYWVTDDFWKALR